jgi:DNA-directed RNA polymerase specialized sigma24 family protein
MIRPARGRIGAALQRAVRACLATFRIAGPAGSDTLQGRYRVAVGALPAEQHAVFMMHRVDDLSVSEIAVRLGMTSAEVEAHLAAALHAIAVALDGD